MKLAQQDQACYFSLKLTDDQIEMYPEPSISINENISVYLSNFVWDYRAVVNPAKFTRE
jgi:hypothetical protein